MADLVIDPGITTGFALMAPGTVYWTRTATKLLDVGSIIDFAMMTADVERVIYEDYRIFAGKAKAHIGSAVYPIQVVGVVRFLAYRYGRPVLTVEPSSKAYVSQEEYDNVVKEKLPTEHQKDAVLLGLYQQRKDALSRKDSPDGSHEMLYL